MSNQNQTTQNSTEEHIEVENDGDTLTIVNHDAEISGINRKLSIKRNIGRLDETEGVTADDQGDATTIENVEHYNRYTYEVELGNDNSYYIHKVNGKAQTDPFHTTDCRLNHTVTRTVEWDLDKIDMDLDAELTEIKGIGPKSNVAGMTVKDLLVDYTENRRLATETAHKKELVDDAVFSCYHFRANNFDREEDLEHDVTLVIDSEE